MTSGDHRDRGGGAPCPFPEQPHLEPDEDTDVEFVRVLPVDVASDEGLRWFHAALGVDLPGDDHTD